MGTRPLDVTSGRLRSVDRAEQLGIGPLGSASFNGLAKSSIATSSGDSPAVAVTGFLTRGRMGRFDAAVQLANLTGQPADTALVRQYRSRYGISVNAEQQVSSDLGIFARAGWASGDIEPYEFSDIDMTVAAGLALSGKRWGRPDDTFGVAGVVNSISSPHQSYLNAGGLGILVGDGKLPNPGSEQIIEIYYSLPVWYWRVTFDYQFIVNPAYNPPWARFWNGQIARAV